jgi:hypothetical protein
MKEVETDHFQTDGYAIEHNVNYAYDASIESCELLNVDSTSTGELFGAPDGWQPPKPPASWNTPEPNETKGEPPFDEVDNPAGWSSFTYCPVFNNKTRQYMHHAMPSDATAVPINPATGKGETGGYEFFYNCWNHPTPDCSNTRYGASKQDLFPTDRNVQLDAELKKMGLTKERMERSDALFLYQLLLPIVNAEFSGIKDDPRMNFYEEVVERSNLYAVHVKKCGGT